MNPDERVVISIPLVELWDDSGTLQATKVRSVDQEGLTDLLRLGPLRFVLASGGTKLQWMSKGECFDFWKNEAKPHIYSEDKPYLEDYPGEYIYWASEWQLPSGESVILLEKQD
jgi:hypothetical protein